MKGTSKKIVGMMIIIIMSLIILFCLFALVYTLAGGEPNATEIVYNFLFFLGLCYFPLNYGIKLWKQGVADLLVIPSIPDGEVVTKKFKITFRSFASLMFRITLSNPSILYITLIGASILVASFLNPESSNTLALVIGLLFFLMPLITFIQLKRSYNMSKNLREEMTYTFNADTVTITGETYNSTFRLNSLYKVRELDKWLLLYTHKVVMMPLSKESFASAEDLNTVKMFLLNTQGVIKEIKY